MNADLHKNNISKAYLNYNPEKVSTDYNNIFRKVSEQRTKAWFECGSIYFVCFLLISAIFIDGCEPLRKKFTRKKKKASVEDETVPLLEPIDYPQKVYSPAETYKHHYSLWQVWNNELQNIVLESAYRKRKIYLVDQIIAHLEVMRNLILEEKQISLISSLERLRKVKSDLEAPVPTRNLSALKRDLALIDKEIRNSYKFTEIESALKQQ